MIPARVWAALCKVSRAAWRDLLFLATVSAAIVALNFYIRSL